MTSEERKKDLQEKNAKRAEEGRRRYEEAKTLDLYDYDTYPEYVQAMKRAGLGYDVEPEYVWQDKHDKRVEYEKEFMNKESKSKSTESKDSKSKESKSKDSKPQTESKSTGPSKSTPTQTGSRGSIQPTGSIMSEYTSDTSGISNTWQDRIRSATATDDDIREAYKAWKEGTYKPGTNTMKEFEKMGLLNEQTEPEAPQETIDKIDTDGDGKISQEEAQDLKNKGLLEKLYGAYRNGELDMYPTLKAIIDSVAKNAQMTADRANILTGKGSDSSIYTPIETETDVMRASTLDSRAEAERMKSAMDKANSGDWSEFAAMQAAGQVTIEQIADSMSMDKEEVQKLMEEGTIARLELPPLTTKKAKADFKADFNKLALSYEQEAAKLRADATKLEKTDDYSVAQEMLNAYRTLYTGRTSVHSASGSDVQGGGYSTGMGAGYKGVGVNLGNNQSENYTEQSMDTLTNDTEWTSRMSSIDSQMKKVINDTSLANKDIAAIFRQMADSYDAEAKRLRNTVKDI